MTLEYDHTAIISFSNGTREAIDYHVIDYNGPWICFLDEVSNEVGTPIRYELLSAFSVESVTRVEVTRMPK